MSKLNAVRRKSIQVETQKIIKISYSEPDQSLPMVVKPSLEGLNLLSWFKNNREFIDENLSQHGAILWRNF